MASPSRPPTCSQYGVKPACYGCGRKIVAKDEPSLWFVGLPSPAVFGACCFEAAAHWKGPNG